MTEMENKGSYKRKIAFKRKKNVNDKWFRC